jgi:hypothetical protein
VIRPAEAFACVAGVGLGALLAAGSALRRGKVVHPHGAVFHARLRVPGAAAAPRGAELLSRPAEHRALVRFSRALGLPRALPDLLGMAIRVLDAYGEGRHQDLLLTTSADHPLLHHVFLPARDVQQRPYTSSLPFQAGDERFIVGALPGAAEGRFELAVAAPRGRFVAVAELSIGEPAPAALDALLFEPWKGGGGLQPVGVLNAMRRYAYPMSNRAWRATARLRPAASRP